MLFRFFINASEESLDTNPILVFSILTFSIFTIDFSPIDTPLSPQFFKYILLNSYSPNDTSTQSFKDPSTFIFLIFTFEKSISKPSDLLFLIFIFSIIPLTLIKLTASSQIEFSKLI